MLQQAVASANADTEDGRSVSVCFLIQHPDLPSSRVRVLDLLPELRRHGIAADVFSYPRTIYSKVQLFRQVRKYDVVVLQKKLPTWPDLVLLRHCAGKLYYDFDDAIYLKDSADGAARSRVRGRRFRQIVMAADRVIAGNRILADQARRWNAAVEILPSAVETRGIPVRQDNSSGGLTVIGWVGTAPNFQHLTAVGPVLRRVAERRSIEVRIVSNEAPELPGVPARFIRWQRTTENAEIAAFDIGIMPLRSTPFAAGKCGYKALQYMAAGVPAVVSDVGVNSEIVRHGTDGLVVSTCEGFFDALLELIDNPDKRRRMGRQARLRVEQEFSVATVAQRLAHALKTSSPAAARLQ
ncbi:MAG: glycosyltransferase family 4 protein [Planctomycetes bacterium]|nr:glycosyltransferase family 4 protein [Planctomycetota bacterium]